MPTNPEPMMSCGHQANATCSKRGGLTFHPPIPCCVICDCVEVDSDAPNLEGRQARCMCGNTRPSSERANLAFFEHRPNHPEGYDSYYCGCHGWD